MIQVFNSIMSAKDKYLNLYCSPGGKQLVQTGFAANGDQAANQLYEQLEKVPQNVQPSNAREVGLSLGELKTLLQKSNAALNSPTAQLGSMLGAAAGFLGVNNTPLTSANEIRGMLPGAIGLLDDSVQQISQIPLGGGTHDPAANEKLIWETARVGVQPDCAKRTLRTTVVTPNFPGIGGSQTFGPLDL